MYMSRPSPANLIHLLHHPQVELPVFPAEQATLAALGAPSTPAPPNGWIKNIRHGLSTIVLHDISFHYVILHCIILHHII